MRVLAIDTALEACAAAVFDTEGGIARERNAADGARPRRGADAAGRQGDERGQAPLRRTRSHRSHHRARQLHRTCGSASRLRAASRSPLASRRTALTTLAVFAGAADGRGRLDPRYGRDRCPPRPRLSADIRHRRPHAGRAAHQPACATPRALPPTDRRASSALVPPWWRRPGRLGEAPPALVEEIARARHQLGGAAWGRGARARGSAEATIPARARRTAAGRREVAAPMIELMTRLFMRAEPVLLGGFAARCSGDCRAACGLVPARLERRRVRAAARSSAT